MQYNGTLTFKDLTFVDPVYSWLIKCDLLQHSRTVFHVFTVFLGTNYHLPPVPHAQHSSISIFHQPCIKHLYVLTNHPPPPSPTNYVHTTHHSSIHPQPPRGYLWAAFPGSYSFFSSCCLDLLTLTLTEKPSCPKLCMHTKGTPRECMNENWVFG